MDDPCKSGMVALRSDNRGHGITCVAPFARVRRTNCEAAYRTSMASVLCSRSFVSFSAQATDGHNGWSNVHAEKLKNVIS